MVELMFRACFRLWKREAAVLVLPCLLKKNVLVQIYFYEATLFDFEGIYKYIYIAGN